MTISNWPWGDLRPFHYGMIMIDPPWKFANWSKEGEEKNACSQYDCMSLEDVKSLPVGHLAAPDCLLWLWATNPMFPQAIETLGAWGFQFKTAGHWVKRTKNDKLAFGTGYILRSAGEPFIIGTIGKPHTSRSVRSVIEGPVREHSRKPDQAYEAAEKLVPNVWRADLFSRERRQGWDNFGDESDKFNELEDEKNGKKRQGLDSPA